MQNKECVTELNTLIDVMRQTTVTGKDAIEFECRLGFQDEQRFCPGVSKEVFEALEKDLNESESLTAEKEWNEIMDYHYVDTSGRNSNAGRNGFHGL